MGNEELIERPAAILFDMDGTLTVPLLDFDAMKREMGIAGKPILETLALMATEEREIARAILDRHEDRAAMESLLNPGCVELLDWVKEAGLSTALITRNSRKSVNTVLDRHGLLFEIRITREDGKFKPDPAPLELACRRLNIAPGDAWMVGDSYHDIQAGAAAGMRTVWISHNQSRDFEPEPWKTVVDLHALTAVLRACHLS